MTYADVFFLGLFDPLGHSDCIKKEKEKARKIAAGCILCWTASIGRERFCLLASSCFLILV